MVNGLLRGGVSLSKRAMLRIGLNRLAIRSLSQFTRNSECCITVGKMSTLGGDMHLIGGFIQAPFLVDIVHHII